MPSSSRSASADVGSKSLPALGVGKAGSRVPGIKGCHEISYPTCHRYSDLTNGWGSCVHSEHDVLVICLVANQVPASHIDGVQSICQVGKLLW